MAAPKIDLSVVIPIFNEEMNLVPMNNRIIAAIAPLQLQYEIIYINDGSKDRSLPIILGLSEDNASVKYIDFSRNFGHQIAISAGLEHASGESIVIMDGDGQDPPELIPELLTKAKEGFEVVYAKRKKRKGESFLKKITAKLFYRFLANITQIEIPLDTGDFRLLTQYRVQEMNSDSLVPATGQHQLKSEINERADSKGHGNTSSKHLRLRPSCSCLKRLTIFR